MSGKDLGKGRSWKSVTKLVASMAAFSILGGCMSSSLPMITVAEANSMLNRGYEISGGDQVRVSVFDEPSLTGEFDVATDGGLSLPLLGTLSAEGKTADELAALITTALTDGGYVIDPRVSVAVAEHRPFYILGEVQAPGEYPYASDLSVEQAIAIAGGYTPRASRSEVVLRRADWPEARRIKLSNTPLLIGPGDTITIDEAFF